MPDFNNIEPPSPTQQTMIPCFFVLSLVYEWKERLLIPHLFSSILPPTFTLSSHFPRSCIPSFILLILIQTWILFELSCTPSSSLLIPPYYFSLNGNCLFLFTMMKRQVRNREKPRDLVNHRNQCRRERGLTVPFILFDSSHAPYTPFAFSDD